MGVAEGLSLAIVILQLDFEGCLGFSGFPYPFCNITISKMAQEKPLNNLGNNPKLWVRRIKNEILRGLTLCISVKKKKKKKGWGLTRSVNFYYHSCDM